MPTLKLSHRVRDRVAFAQYVVLGGCGTALDVALFFVLVQTTPLHPVVANVLSTTAGIALSFALNARFTFKVSDRILRRFVSFGAVGLVGLAVTAVMLEVGHGALGLDPRIVKTASLPVVAVLQFLLNRHVTFATSPFEEKTVDR
jgi:putative flippase GtrA